MGIGDWGLGIGDWGLGPIPNPQSPIPNPQSPIPIINSNYLTFSKIKKNNYFKINKVYYLEIKMNYNANKTRILYNIIIFLVNKLTNLKFY